MPSDAKQKAGHPLCRSWFTHDDTCAAGQAEYDAMWSERDAFMRALDEPDNVVSAMFKLRALQKEHDALRTQVDALAAALERSTVALTNLQAMTTNRKWASAVSEIITSARAVLASVRAEGGAK